MTPDFVNRGKSYGLSSTPWLVAGNEIVRQTGERVFMLPTVVKSALGSFEEVVHQHVYRPLEIVETSAELLKIAAERRD